MGEIGDFIYHPLYSFASRIFTLFCLIFSKHCSRQSRGGKWHCDSSQLMQLIEVIDCFQPLWIGICLQLRWNPFRLDDSFDVVNEQKICVDSTKPCGGAGWMQARSMSWRWQIEENHVKQSCKTMIKITCVELLRGGGSQSTLNHHKMRFWS